MTLAPVGSKGPAGDCVKGRTKVPSIHVWPSIEESSASVTARSTVRRSAGQGWLLAGSSAYRISQGSGGASFPSFRMTGESGTEMKIESTVEKGFDGF